MPKFIKGQSGNPKGRPKGRKTLTESIAELLNCTNEEILEKFGPEATLSDELANLFISTLIANPTNAKLWALFFERTEGKVSQTLDINKTTVNINAVETNKQFDEFRRNKLLGLEPTRTDSHRRGTDIETSSAYELAEGSNTESQEE